MTCRGAPCASLAAIVALVGTAAWVLRWLCDWGGLDSPRAWSVPETHVSARKRTDPVP